MASDTYELWTEKANQTHFTVSGFDGEEGISKLYRFDIRGFCSQAPEDCIVVGEPVAFFISHGGELSRAIHGVVARITAIGRATASGHQEFSLRIVPRIWLAKQRVASRIFQGKTVIEIVNEILAPVLKGAPWQGEIKSRVIKTYKPLPYCVQYEESDFAFVKRILAEEGIFWYFEYNTKGPPVIPPPPDVRVYFPDALVLADDPYSGYQQTTAPPLAPLLHLRPWDSSLLIEGDSCVKTLEQGMSLKPEGIQLRDYTFEHPMLNPEKYASLPHPPTTAGISSGKSDSLYYIYTHRSDYEYREPEAQAAAVRLEQHRRRASVALGETAYRRIIPGYLIHVDILLNATVGHVLGGLYAVTTVKHTGTVPEFVTDITDPLSVYSAKFEGVPRAVPYRPRRPRRRRLQVLESAVVVGPPGEEIHTDEYGRIRIQFHWDLKGGYDEKSSVWIRVAQGWAGTGFGLQLIPRVGSEVLVSFLHGDQDCPVVVGALHNATHPTTFRLPMYKTRSGFRTQSSPGGLGYSELSFDDAAGSELLRIRAQKDLDTEVGDSHTFLVKGSQWVDIRGDEAHLVKGNQTEQIRGRAERRIEEDETVHVKGTRLEVVEGNLTTEIHQENRLRVLGNESRHVLGESTLRTGDDLTTRSEGSLTVLVGKEDAPRSHSTAVEGRTDLHGKDLVEISSEKGIRLRCGKSILELTPERIELTSPTISIHSAGARILIDHDDIVVGAKKSAAVRSPSTELSGQASSLKLKSDASLDGSKVLIKSPGMATDSMDNPPPTVTKLELKDDKGKPIPYQRYVLVFDDGSERSGFLDAHGQAEVDLEKPANVLFPGLIETASG